MSRERPIPAPRAVPDEKRGLSHSITARKERAVAEAARLKSFSGPGFIGYLGATFSRGRLERAPQFIRRGHEANIVDELNDFYAARPRPWRPASRSSCRPTHKERLKMQRQAKELRWHYVTKVSDAAQFVAGDTMDTQILRELNRA